MSKTSNSNLTDDGFQKVTYKNKFRKSKRTLKHQSLQLSNIDFDEKSSIRRILDAKLDILATDFFDSVTALLKEGLSALNNTSISEIICLGLGKIGECTTARYQFALLLCLKELYAVDICVYDPIFNENDIHLLSHFEINVLGTNLEGKYKIQNKKTTLFYFPHCPKQLTNNLLWANWGLNLNHCIIVSNSFNKIIESTSQKTLLVNAEYIRKITPYVLELAVINTFKYYEVFNDTSIHVFPKLNLVSPDLWEFCIAPKYLDEDVEYVTNDIHE